MSDDIDPLRPRPTQDTRGFFMLPQSPMDSGYYAYGKLFGKPAKGAYQYAPPIMMTSILRVALEWQAIDRRRIGVGDISMAGGPKNHLIISPTGMGFKSIFGRCAKTESRRPLRGWTLNMTKRPQLN